MANLTPQQAEQVFNQNYAAIQQAKAQTGDWEKAFQMVTGQPWPSGQHITIDQGGGHAVKDSSWLKKAANIALTAAPIVAAPFTGGSTLALLGAGAGATKGLINGGGLKGALLGGGLGAASGLGGKYISNLLGKAGVPGMGAAGNMAGSGNGDFIDSAISGVANQAGGGGSSAIDALLANANVPMGHLITDPNATSQSGGSWIDKLLGGVKKAVSGPSDSDGQNGQGWGDMASVIGAYGQAEANNRKTKGDFLQDYDKINLDYVKENQDRESDAMRKLAQTSYIMGGGSPYTAPKLNSGQTVDLGYGPKAPSQAQIQGATSLQQQLGSRLTPEGALKPTDPNQYINEGTGEKVAKYGSLITGGLGAAKNIFGF